MVSFVVPSTRTFTIELFLSKSVVYALHATPQLLTWLWDCKGVLVFEKRPTRLVCGNFCKREAYIVWNVVMLDDGQVACWVESVTITFNTLPFSSKPQKHLSF
jgi:hypothetical protein